MGDLEIQRLSRMIKASDARGYIRTMRVVTGSMRLKILMLLGQSKDGITVTELAKVLGGSLSRISHQIGILKRAGLVTVEREGRNATYSLSKGKSVYKYASLGQKMHAA